MNTNELPAVPGADTSANPRNAVAGDIVAAWHDTVAFGAKLVYARVVRRGEKMLRVQFERSGTVTWKHPHYFNHIARGSELAEIAPLFSSVSERKS